MIDCEFTKRQWQRFAFGLGIACLGGAGIASEKTYFREFPVYHWVEYTILCAGIIVMLSAFRANKGISNYICPECETSISSLNVGSGLCPKCNTKLEPLEGFYERHPELKNE